MAEASGEKKGKFEPKQPVTLDPPKDDPFTPDQLAKYDGMRPSTASSSEYLADTSQESMRGTAHMSPSR